MKRFEFGRVSILGTVEGTVARWDLHTHCNVGSDCTDLEPSTILREASEKGLSGICITDHIYFHSRDGPRRDYTEARKEAEKLGMGLIVGFEATGVQSWDFLVFLPEGEVLDEDRCKRWLRQVEEMTEGVHSLGGAVIHAHPYGQEYQPVSGIDGVEILNGNANRDGVPVRVIDGSGLAFTGGSDCHFPHQVGRCYTKFDDEVRNAADLIRALKDGRCSAGAIPFQR